MSRISIIIPALNEADNLEQLLPYLSNAADTPDHMEILVVDGGSTDSSVEVATRYGARVLTSAPGRAIQMNTGARQANGELLYFLHADSFPPKGFDTCIRMADASGKGSGCFRLVFDNPSRVLRGFAWFTRLNWRICRGGDQSLFIRKSWFETLGGYNPRFIIYEDNEFTGRIYAQYPFTVLPETIRTSARAYERIGVWRLQYHFAIIHLKRLLGTSPEGLYTYYRKYIRNGAA